MCNWYLSFLDLGPNPGPQAQFVFDGLGPRSVFSGHGPQFLFACSSFYS